MRAENLRRPVAVLFFVAVASTATGVPRAAPTDPDRMVKEVERIVAAVASAPDLSRKRIEGILGASLSPVPSRPNGPPDAHDLAATLADGPFARVELREAEPWQKRSILVLEVRGGVELPLQRFSAEHLGQMQDVNAHIPPEGTVTYSAGEPPLRTLFQFHAKRRTLRSVAVHLDVTPTVRRPSADH